ncbi:MAG: carboxypeptidase regulatory-like domain-containing protein [Planctomycetota bacterium]|nr:MAG: carboxypeptidase regulatory-like domain-containing protein [Planctomycetota bacterium]
MAEPRSVSARWLPAAAAVLLAVVGWVLLGPKAAPPSPPPAPAPTVAEAEPDLAAAGAAELRPLPGEGPIVVELRSLGADDQADRLVRIDGELRGRVLGEGGEPRPHALLRVRGGPQDGLEAEADAEGAFRLIGLLPGTHLIEIRAGGFTAVRQQRVLAHGPTRREFIVGRAIPLALEVHGHDGEPLAGARVDLGAGGEVLETGEDGLVLFPAVPRGPRVVVAVSAPEHVPLRQELNLMPRNPGGAPVRIDLPRGGRIRGRVKSWPGPPLPVVTIVPREDRPGSWSVAWDTWHQLPIDPDGWFELKGVPPTRVVDVRVFHPGGVAEPEMRSVRAGVETPTTVVFNIIRRDTRISGRVVDPDGRPVPGARVVLEAADPAAVLGRLYPGLAQGPVAAVLPTPAALRREVRADGAGRFDFDYGDHPPGSGHLLLRASKEGYAAASSLVRNARSNFSLVLRPVPRDAEIVLRLPPGAAAPPVEWWLDGRRLDRDGPRLGPVDRGHYEVRVLRGDEELLPRQVLSAEPRLELELG